MSKNGIGALERGYRRTPQRETLGLLAGALALNAEQRRTLEAAAGRSGTSRRGGASVTLGPWADTGTSNLPLSLTSFVGRETELDELASLIRDHRLVTLTGSAGIGKTQTALRLGASIRDAATGGVAFVGLALIRNPAAVVGAIAAAVGVQEVPSRPLLATLIGYLKNRVLLLILDNCEHVIADAAIAAEALLTGCSRVRILATSRELIHAGGEYVYRLPSLSADDAIELFAERARATDHLFTLTEETTPIVADLCRRLDHIPLAIELAAARVNLLSLRALAEKLDDRFAVLSHGERTASPRQQTMRATIDWSYDLLSSEEQRLFERLSVFAGGCSLVTAAAVCVAPGTSQNDVLELLGSLVDKSLAVADLQAREPRYHLLESFRKYAREKLASRQEVEVIGRLHAQACLALAERFDRAYDAEPDEVWLELGRIEIDNWRAAMEWALIDRNEVELGQRLVCALRPLWEYFVPLEGARWLARARELIDASTPESLLAELDFVQADVAWQLRDYHLQLTSSERAIARSRELGDLLGLARAQSLAAYALMSLGRFPEAKPVLEEALDSAQRLGNRRLLAYLLRGLGYVSALSGDIISARNLMTSAREIYEAIGATLSAKMALLHDLAWIEFHASNSELALQYETATLALARDLGNKRFAIMALNAVAGFLIALGRYDEADKQAREALLLARDQQLDVLVAEAMQHLAAIAALRPALATSDGSSARARAARILGFVDARLASLGSTRIVVLRPEYDCILAQLRDTMQPNEIAARMAEGAAMSEDRVIEET